MFHINLSGINHFTLTYLQRCH